MSGQKMIIALPIIFLLGFTGCSDLLNTENTYYVEFYALTPLTYSSFESTYSPEEALTYAKSQPGTFLAQRKNGYTIRGFENMLHDLNLPESLVAKLTELLEQRGSVGQLYITVSYDFILLYAKRE